MRTFTLLALFLSAQAFACPDLTGAYTCKYRDGSSEIVTITQSADKAGIIVFLYNGSSIPADNQIYDVPDDEHLRNGKFRAWCDDTLMLKTELIGKYWNNGSYFGDLVMGMNFSKEGNNLKTDTTGSVVNSGGTYPLDSSMVCVHNP